MRMLRRGRRRKLPELPARSCAGPDDPQRSKQRSMYVYACSWRIQPLENGTERRTVVPSPGSLLKSNEALNSAARCSRFSNPVPLVSRDAAVSNPRPLSSTSTTSVSPQSKETRMFSASLCLRAFVRASLRNVTTFLDHSMAGFPSGGSPSRTISCFTPSNIRLEIDCNRCDSSLQLLALGASNQITSRIWSSVCLAPSEMAASRSGPSAPRRSCC